jgi:hypothetical protein
MAKAATQQRLGEVTDIGHDALFFARQGVSFVTGP